MSDPAIIPGAVVIPGVSPTAPTPLGGSDAPPPQLHDPAPRSTGRMVEGVTRVTLSAASGAATVEQAPHVQQHKSSSDAADTRGRGPLATARSINGLPRSGPDLDKPGTIITIRDPASGRDFDTDIQAALAAGFIRKGATGGYVDAEQSAPQQQQQQDQQQQDEPANAKVPDLPAAVHSLATEFNERVGNIEATSALRQMTEGARIDDETASRIAGQMGLEASEVHSRAEIIRAAYEAQAHELAGPNAHAAFEWARNAEPAMLKAAIKAHVEQEDGSGYGRVVNAYLDSMQFHSPQMILNSPNAAELRPRIEPDGQVTIETQQFGRMSWSTALRMGCISPRLNG